MTISNESSRVPTKDHYATASAPSKVKLHGRKFYESLGSPKFVLAPMVDQSEFVWLSLLRILAQPGSVLTTVTRHGEFSHALL